MEEVRLNAYDAKATGNQNAYVSILNRTILFYVVLHVNCITSIELIKDYYHTLLLVSTDKVCLTSVSKFQLLECRS